MRRKDVESLCLHLQRMVSDQVTSAFGDLMKIIQFGLLKVAPGLFNIGLIPFLVTKFGPEAYGDYSLWLSYAMLVATVVGAVLTQPMYRYLASHPGERELFNSFMLATGGIAGAFSIAVGLKIGAPLHLAGGLAVFSLGTVLSSGIGVSLQIERRIGRLAVYEMLRVLTIFVSIALPLTLGQNLTISHVVLGLAVSNFVPLLMLMEWPRFGKLELGWLRKVALYGAKSSAWLFLAGLPLVGSKTILSTTLNETAFGTYSAITDIAYRGFGMLNAAVTMWAFPLLSQRFDSGAYDQVRGTLRFALTVYAVAGVLILIGGIGLVKWQPFLAAPLSGGFLAVVSIVFASFTWQAMSIAHKPFELNVQTTQMLLLLAFGVGIFFGIQILLGKTSDIDPVFSITLSMIGVAGFYSLISFNISLRR